MTRDRAIELLLSTRGTAVLAVAGALLTLALRWPGTLPFDALNQLAQARSGQYTDGNPPSMAALWRILGAVPQSMLILQVALFWTGLWLIASTLRDKWRLAVLAVGLSPVALYYNGVVQKDSLLAACFMLAAGLMARRWQWSAAIAAVAGAMIRANGGFAIAPLIFRRRRLLWTIPISLLMIAAVTLSARFVFEAQSDGLERGLQLYDITGIARFSGERSVLPVEIAEIEQCYTPFFWDTLGEQRCDGAFGKLPGSITSQWLRAVAGHPISYLRHRLNYFNSATFFIVPPMQQCVEAPEMHDCRADGQWRDLLIKNAFFWPCLWLAIGAVLLAVGNIGATASALALSSLLYGFAYLFVGVASDFRYFYWTEIAIQVALVLALARGVSLRAPLMAGGLVILVGYAARIAFLV